MRPMKDGGEGRRRVRGRDLRRTWEREDVFALRADPRNAQLSGGDVLARGNGLETVGEGHVVIEDLSFSFFLGGREGEVMKISTEQADRSVQHCDA